jgi:hypothetical protein
MKREALKMILLLLTITVPSFAVSIPHATGELQHNMPVVYIDPQYSTASEGAIFNVSVRVFNLTDGFYSTDNLWKLGRNLPDPGTRYNYTLGNMYGFKIRLSWNPLILECVSQVIKTPVEDYPDGVLHGPLLAVQSDLNSSAGTFSVSQSSWLYPVAGFNCPDRNATLFVLSFKVKREELSSYLRLDYVELTPDPNLAGRGILETIPLLPLNGVFKSENTTLVTAMTAGAIVGTQLLTPVILGENACVRFTMKNEGRYTDSYNLTLYKDGAPVETWVNGSLVSGDSKTYNYTFKTEGMELGLHTLTVEAYIIHRGTPLTCSSDVSFILIHAPSMNVGRPTQDVYENETVVLNAFESTHPDPNVEIQNYTWLLYEPGATSPEFKYEGESVTHQFVKNGTWRIVLLVEDNWKISYNSSRNATEPYMEEVLLDVQSGEKPLTVEVFTPVQIALVVLLTSFVLLGVALYVIWERRTRLHLDDISSTLCRIGLAANRKVSLTCKSLCLEVHSQVFETFEKH